MIGYFIFYEEIKAHKPNEGNEHGDADKKYKEITHTDSPFFSEHLVTIEAIIEGSILLGA